MRNLLRITLASSLISLVACSAPQEPSQRRLFESHNIMRHAGFNGLGPITSGELEVGGSQNLRARLAENACYVLAAFGSEGLRDLGLTVINPEETPLAEERGIGQTAIISFCTERAGEHQIAITAEEGEGSYYLTYWMGGGEAGEGATQLTLGRPVMGMLPPGQPFVEYSLRIQQQRLVTIDLESREFDTYLYLLRDGVELHRDDDGGSGLNSRMVMPLEPGTYTVRVGSFGGRGSGPFTLVAR
jgi:hypothetical protein